jgi:hypothetical protein
MPILLGVQPVHGGVEPVVRGAFAARRTLIGASEERLPIRCRLIAVTPGVQAVDGALLMRLLSGAGLSGSVAAFGLQVAHIRCIDPVPHSFVTCGRKLIASVGNGVALVGDPVALVSRAVALIGDPVTFIGHVRPLVGRRSDTFHTSNLCPRQRRLNCR